MTIKTIQLFETPDGKQFTSLEEAQDHVIKASTRGALADWARKWVATLDTQDLVDAEDRQAWLSYELGQYLDNEWSTLADALTARMRLHEELKGTEDVSLLSRRLDDLFADLHGRTLNPLTAKFTYVGEVVQLGERALVKVKGLGKKGVEELQEALAKHDLYLDMDVEDWTKPSELDALDLGQLFHMAYAASSADDDATEVLAKCERVVRQMLGIPRSDGSYGPVEMPEEELKEQIENPADAPENEESEDSNESEKEVTDGDDDSEGGNGNDDDDGEDRDEDGDDEEKSDALAAAGI